MKQDAYQRAGLIGVFDNAIIVAVLYASVIKPDDFTCNSVRSLEV